MRRIVPSRELVTYLDHELGAPVGVPPGAAARVRAGLRPLAGPVGVAFALVAFLAVTFVVVAALVITAVAYAKECAVPASSVMSGPEEVTSSMCDVPPLAAPPPVNALCVRSHSPRRAPRPNSRPRLVQSRGRAWSVVVAVLAALGAVGLVVGEDALRARRRRRAAAFRAQRLGGVSRSGGRKHNEDRVATFSVGAFDVLGVADGLGGHAGGARAASLVIESAERHLRSTLVAIGPDHAELVEDAVRGAFARAGVALAAEERALGLAALGVDGLRSTLIIAVATPELYVVGAQGDGGALVRRADGTLVALMSPAKAGAQNILAASLGPVSEGQVDLRRETRRAGDTLIVSSDGVADRVTDVFYKELADIVAKSATVEVAINDVLDELEQAPDIFNDNVTLAILATGPT